MPSAPTLKNRDLRRLIDCMLPTDADLNAFCLDHLEFHIAQRVESIHDRTAKVNLLLTWYQMDLGKLFAALEDVAPERLATWMQTLQIAGKMPPAPRSCDLSSAGRLLGYGDPILHCDRKDQWHQVRDLIETPRHELLLLPGAYGQAHSLFLGRIEKALPQPPPHRIVWIHWKQRAPRQPTFPTYRDEFLLSLFQGLKGSRMSHSTVTAETIGSAIAEELQQNHLILLHPVVDRGHGNRALVRYYREWLPSLLPSASVYACKCVQPISWAAANPVSGLMAVLRRGLGNASVSIEQQASFWAARGLLRELSAKGTFRASVLPRLRPLGAEDIVEFLTAICYGHHEEDSEQARRDLAGYVLRDGTSSEAVLLALCDLLPGYLEVPR